MRGAYQEQGRQITVKERNGRKKIAQLRDHVAFHLNTKRELYAHVDITGHFDDFGELDRFFSGILQIFHGKDFEAGFVDLLVMVS